MNQPSKFSDLSPARQNKLIAHFMSEFDMSRADARKHCRALDADDFALHLEACEQGYI